MLGRVTFWVATAPTRARAQGQRAPTQMLEVVIATPIMPVRSHRPTIENVMPALPRRVRSPAAQTSSSGMTASMSISIRISGSARPLTIRPVEHGWTPFSHLPITR